MTDEEKDIAIRKITERFLVVIREHVSAAQVCVTWENEDDETLTTNLGSGNWNARAHMCRRFITRDDASETADVTEEE